MALGTITRSDGAALPALLDDDDGPATLTPWGAAPLPTRPDGADAASSLALAYQRGDLAALAPLHEAVRPLLRMGLARAVAGPLPASLSRDDLTQQTWLILADLARRWNPALGQFGAYVRVSYPFALGKYIAEYGSRRRSARVRVLSLPDEELRPLAEALAGEDGRTWDGALQLRELIDGLGDQERTAVLLRVVGGHRLKDVARYHGMGRIAVHRLVRRGLRRLAASLHGADRAN